jgi:acid phosphatase type 7
MNRLHSTLSIVAGIALAGGFTVGGIDASVAHARRQGQGTSDSIVTVMAAGDVAACLGGELMTARLLQNTTGPILVLGDAAYESKANPNPYESCFDLSWGTYKARVRPVIGNHDFQPHMLRKYFDYFGEAAGPQPGGYYSFDAGRWHIIALNTNIDVGPRSKQGKWLAEDLAANKTKCTLAVMHHPQFSSGPHSPQWQTRAAYIALDSAQVEVIVSGHDHTYERFMPMNVDGQPVDDAPRQFVVGTGGGAMYQIKKAEKGSEIYQDRNFGVLKLTLAPDSYTWEYLSIEGFSFKDSGSGRCY